MWKCVNVENDNVKMGNVIGMWINAGINRVNSLRCSE